MEFRKKFGRVGPYSVLIQLDAFDIIEIPNVSVLVLVTVDTISVTTSFSLLFQEGVNVLGEETTVTRLWIVSCHLILI